jgi:hypothetical protein
MRFGTNFISRATYDMTIANDGNVGIGTTSPGAKLQVDVSSATGIRVNGTGGYANILSQGGHLEFYKDSTPTYAAAIGLSTPATALSNDIQFATYNGSSWSARMTIVNGGYVGIGTSTTTSGLQIQTEGTNTTSGSFLFVRSTNASFGGGAIGVGYQFAAPVGNNYYPFRIRAGTTNAIFLVNSAGVVYAGDTTGAIAYGNHDPYYAFNQDTNTGMDWAAADTLTFKTGGSEKIRITSDGDVGISNSSPLSGVSAGLTLGAIGTVKCFNIGMFNTYGRIRERDQIDALAITTNISDGGTQDSSTRSSWKLRMGWGNGQDNFLISRSPVSSNVFADLFYIKSDGNVGIGTTAPVTKLHIKGGTELLNTSGSTSGATSSSLMIVGQNTKGGANYHDFLYTRNSKATLNPNKHFRQDNTGNLEIINSAYGANIFTLSDSGSLVLPTAQSRNVTQLRNTGAGLKVGNYGLLFDDGNVHLHSTSPGTNLWLNCSGSGMFVVNGQSGATNGMCVGTSIQSGFVTIVGSKSVSIAQPYGYLISSGAGSTTGTSPNPYSLTCDNRIMSSEFNAPSDERLKNIKGEISLDKAIDFVTKIDPIEFTWKDGVDTGLKAGYSAQQTYKAGFEHLIGVVPKQGMEEIVEPDGFISPKDAQFVMNYEQVTPYHSKLIKHLLDKIEQLENRISQLESKQ